MVQSHKKQKTKKSAQRHKNQKILYNACLPIGILIFIKQIPTFVGMTYSRMFAQLCVLCNTFANFAVNAFLAQIENIDHKTNNLLIM